MMRMPAAIKPSSAYIQMRPAHTPAPMRTATPTSDLSRRRQRDWYSTNRPKQRWPNMRKVMTIATSNQEVSVRHIGRLPISSEVAGVTSAPTLAHSQGHKGLQGRQGQAGSCCASGSTPGAPSTPPRTRSYGALHQTLSLTGRTQNDEDLGLEACFGAVLGSAGRRGERRRRGEAGTEAFRGRGPRHIHTGARRPGSQGDRRRDQPWRRGDRFRQGGAHLLGTKLRPRGRRQWVRYGSAILPQPTRHEQRLDGCQSIRGPEFESRLGDP